MYMHTCLGRNLIQVQQGMHERLKRAGPLLVLAKYTAERMFWLKSRGCISCETERESETSNDYIMYAWWKASSLLFQFYGTT